MVSVSIIKYPYVTRDYLQENILEGHDYTIRKAHIYDSLFLTLFSNEFNVCSTNLFRDVPFTIIVVTRLWISKLTKILRLCVGFRPKLRMSLLYFLLLLWRLIRLSLGSSEWCFACFPLRYWQPKHLAALLSTSLVLNPEK